VKREVRRLGKILVSIHLAKDAVFIVPEGDFWVGDKAVRSKGCLPKAIVRILVNVTNFGG
jgi:hypothetical protein